MFPLISTRRFHVMCVRLSASGVKTGWQIDQCCRLYTNAFIMCACVASWIGSRRVVSTWSRSVFHREVNCSTSLSSSMHRVAGARGMSVESATADEVEAQIDPVSCGTPCSGGMSIVMALVNAASRNSNQFNPDQLTESMQLDSY